MSFFLFNKKVRNHSILCIDDEQNNLDMLSRLLNKDYKVLTALSGESALKILNKQKNISLIISDQKMPNITGVELLKQSIKTHPDSIRILLTGYSDVNAIIQAINQGHVYHYLTKPWDPPKLHNIVKNSLAQFDLKQELKHKNEQLTTALIEIKKLDQLKTDFMMLVNHELKTPITNILNFCKLLETSNSSEDRTSYLAHIEEAGWQLNKLTEETLLFISAEAGLLKLNPTTFSVREVVSEVLEKLTEDIENKKQSIQVDVQDIKIKTDKTTLTNILQHLVHNSIKFSPEDSTVDIKVTQKESITHFLIANTGPSIPEDIIKKIMSPFTLFENSLNHSQGFGLGLSLCQALLKAQDSQLVLTNQNKITTTSFELKTG